VNQVRHLNQLKAESAGIGSLQSDPFPVLVCHMVTLCFVPAQHRGHRLLNLERWAVAASGNCNL